MKGLKAFAAALAILGTASAAKASVYAFTSFEEGTVGNQYVDTGDASMDHVLINNAGESDVNYVAGTNAPGLELGFSAFYTNTRGGVGLTDGDFVGVTDFTGTVGAYTDGNNGYQMQDADGKMTTTVDTVAIMGTSPTVALDLYIQSTGWEADDVIRVWVETSDAGDIDLLNTTGSDIDDLLIEDTWLTLTTPLPLTGTATVKFELDSNSASEAIFVDNIRFDTVPEPATLALLGLGGIAMIRRRR